MGFCVSAWVLINLWLASYGCLWPPHSENRSYALDSAYNISDLI